jgi:peroxiredoxin
MRKLILLAALTASLSGLLLFGATLPRKAPEFVFTMTDGTQQLLSQYRGKTIVLAFMFTTCPHCQHTAQVLTKVQTEYKDRGVQVLGACFDESAATRTRQFNQQLGLNFPVGVSTQGPVLEFVQSPPNDPYFVPILVFIDKTGTIRSQYIGDEKFLNQQETNIRLEIDKMLKGSAAAPKAAPKS